QFLETRLDFGALSALLQTKRVQCFAFGVARPSPLGLAVKLTATNTAPAELTENIERIGARIFGVEAAFCSRTSDAACPELPGREVTGERILLITRHRVVAHASEKIIRVIVFADVIETETPVLVFSVTSFRRTMCCRLLAIRPVTAPVGYSPAVLIGFDPNAI